MSILQFGEIGEACDIIMKQEYSHIPESIYRNLRIDKYLDYAKDQYVMVLIYDDGKVIKTLRKIAVSREDVLFGQNTDRLVLGMILCLLKQKFPKAKEIRQMLLSEDKNNVEN